MKSMAVIIIRGIYDNLWRILFASGRKTSMQMRKKIASGTVEYPRVVNDDVCIGCSACANICPVDAIEMVALEEPVSITEDYVKEKRPVFDPLKCMYCFQCHDSCPIFAFYGKPAAVHPRHVGDSDVNVQELLQRPITMKDKKEFDEVVALLDEKAKKLVEDGPQC